MIVNAPEFFGQRVRAATLALACCGALAGCGGGGGDLDAPGDSALKVYKHSFDEAPRTLDPARSATLYTNFIVVNAYDTLYSYKYLKRPFELKPNLATALPEFSDDGLTLTIRLKQGVRFIDDESFAGGKGREVTAHDFVYSLKRHFDPESLSQGAWFWQNRIVGLDDWGTDGADYTKDVAGLRALDDHTVQIKLIKPYPQIIHTLAQGFAAIVPKEAVDRYGRELSVRPVGSGPFRVTRFDSTQAVLERNENFREEAVDLTFEGFDPALHSGLDLEKIDGRYPPFVDRIEINFISDDSSRVTSLAKGGELDYARLPSAFFDRYLDSKTPPKLKPQYEERYKMLTGIEPAFVYHSFNMADPEFGYNPDPQREARNKALRCAMIKGYDWGERNDRFYAGVAKVFPGAIPPVIPEFDPALSLDSVSIDVAAAKKLLADNGWTADTLPEMIYGVSSSVRQTQMFEQFRGFMQAIGYPREKIVLKQYATFGDLSQDWKNARLPIITKAWGLDFPDAENTLQLYYGPNASPGSNDTNYRNPEYDRLYEQASILAPGDERTAIYRRMNEMTIDDCLSMSGLSRTMIFLWDKNVIAYPDRNIVGGFWARYVDTLQ
ncbi:MAG: ABC transporter substrate-binding protein [Gammaproteobacteria bacterium]